MALGAGHDAVRALKGATAALVLACAVIAPGRAEALQLEYEVKANYLVRFAAFVQWPAGAFATPTTPVSICILGPDPFGAELDRALSGQTVNNRPIVARRLQSADRAGGCHIVYVGRVGRGGAEAALSSLAEAPALTVTDGEQRGPRGMIHFAIQQNRVRFHIDEAAAARAGLSISSRLLNLALSVTGRR